MNSSFSSGMARMSLRVGYGFHPTDEELVNYYLKLKNQGRDDDVRTIAVVDIYEHEPWDLPVLSEVKSNDRIWYFFSRRDYKYGKSKRYKRTTGKGYWKSTGERRKVMAKSNKKQIGTKRTLVFHIGRPKGTRTGWVMQEYEHDQGNFVLYKLKRKPDEKISKGEPNQWTAVVASEFQNQDLSPMTANSLHQQVYHMTYDVDDQRLNKVNATSNDESSHSIPRFENQTSVTGDCTLPMVILSDFEHQSPHKKGGCLMTSNLQNRIITYGEGESSLMVTPSDSDQTPDGKGGGFLDSYFENEISPYVKGDGILISTFKNQISVCGDGEFSPLAISSDFRSKYPYEMDDCLLTSDLEDPISGVDFKYLLTSFSRPPSDFKEQSIYEKDDCLKTSDLQNPISDAELEQQEQNYPIPPPFCLEDQSTFYKGELYSLSANDFRKDNSDDKANISVSEEGESSSLKATPSDFADQNQFQMTDMQNLDVNWDFLKNVDVESILTMLEPMANAAAEPQCTLNSELQGSKFTDEIPNNRGLEYHCV